MEGTSAGFAGPDPRLIRWLTAKAIDYELHCHPLAVTARETARAEGVAPESFAKVVGVHADDGRPALIVLDATDHLDLWKAASVMNAAHVRLMTEAELDRMAQERDVGAVPAVGKLFGIPMYADFAVRDDPVISFNAGSHRFTVRVGRQAWERATGVVYADLAREFDSRPAWSRS